jgi:hypothetical protein
MFASRYGTIWRFFAKEKTPLKNVTAAGQDRTERPSGCAGKKARRSAIASAGYEPT